MEDSKGTTKDLKDSSAEQTIPVAQEDNSDNNQSMSRSRIRKSLERRSKKTLFFSFLGFILLIILLVMYGQAILINFTLLLGKVAGKQEVVIEDTAPDFIPPPILDSLPNATNSAKIIISGQVTTGKNDQIKLYINDEAVDVTNPKENETFVFNDVILNEGENKIKAVTVIKNSKSSPSNTITITYLKEPPELTVDEPQDGSSYSGEHNTITIKGKTDPNVTVKVNNFLAITKDDGAFSYTSFPLQNSENKINIVATDKAGNKTEKEIKVTYSP